MTVAEVASRFRIGTRLVAGLGSVNGIGTEAVRLNIANAALIVDVGVMKAGLVDRLILCMGGLPTVLCDPVRTANVATVESIAQGCIESKCDGVVVVGGGSALGVGKAVALRLRNGGSIEDYEGTSIARYRPAPTVAVPTTAGSGSEVSSALVLHEPGRLRNIVVRGAGYEPDVAVLDGELMDSLPAEAALHAALDALSHALESLWVKNQSFPSRSLATTAAGEIMATLPVALATRRHTDMQRLLEASALANLACGNTGMGLVHALSSAPSIVPHGLCNAIFMPGVASFNRDYLTAEASSLVDGLDALYSELGLRRRFAQAELADGFAERTLAAAMTHPNRENNIRSSSQGDLVELIRRCT